MRTVENQLTTASPAPEAFTESVAADVRVRTEKAGLKSRTFTNGFVTATAQCVQLALNIGSTVILARLLNPRDFGIVAMVLSLVSFFRVFSDMGLSTATIQQATITPAQISNLFWLNVGVGGIVSCVFAAISPLVAWFFAEPRLVAVNVTLALSFVLSASTVQHLALLKRHMLFGKIAAIQVSAFFGAACTGVVMAYFGFGYWSLVVMQLFTPLLTCILTWIISDWRPQLPRLRSGTRPLVSFGAKLAASGFIWSIARGSDTILVGKVFGSAAVGLYSRAAVLLIRPIDQLMSPIEAVMVPTLSRLLPEPDRYRRAVLEMYEIVALATFVFSGLIFALSRPFILALLGPRWEQAVPIFAGFSLQTLYIPLAGMASWLLTSQGRGKDSLFTSVVGSAVTVCAFAVGLAFGPAGVATCYSLCCLFIFLPLVYYISGREGPVRTGDLWRRFFTHSPVWIVTALATYSTQFILHTSPSIVQLIASTLAGLATACVFILIYTPSRKAALGMRQSLLQWRASMGAQNRRL